MKMPARGSMLLGRGRAGGRATGNPMIRTAGPLAAAAILAAMLAAGGVDAHRPPDTEQYFATVKAAIERIPYQIGPWTGADQEVVPAAVRLLKPNKILQRRYVNPATGEWFNLLIVHCGDVRDMQGHYPPVCYPAHGWRQDRFSSTTLSVEGVAIPARVYDFRQPAGPRETGMVVVNFFVMPEGAEPQSRLIGLGDPAVSRSPAGSAFSDEMEAVRRVARARALAGLGAAQVQVITSSEMPEAARRELVGVVLPAIMPAVAAVAQGPPVAGSQGSQP
jgi:hypothetical protein